MQGITHVVRGADLLSNTARQLALQRALGLPTPCYLHVPIATNDRGEKLSKQTLAPTLPEAPHAIMQTLREAWSFLRQDDLPHCHTPEDFLCHAVAAWRPEHLYQSSRERASANL
jgi:glutamyl-Q tRNA(Asp) synthetase